MVAANQQPDHATIARFRATHETAIGALFGQVLAVCARQGLLRPGLVAIDGTRMVANASKEANRTAEQVAQQILAEAAALDADEDAEAAQRDDQPGGPDAGIGPRFRDALETVVRVADAGGGKVIVVDADNPGSSAFTAATASRPPASRTTRPCI